MQRLCLFASPLFTREKFLTNARILETLELPVVRLLQCALTPSCDFLNFIMDNMLAKMESIAERIQPGTSEKEVHNSSSKYVTAILFTLLLDIFMSCEPGPESSDSQHPLRVSAHVSFSFFFKRGSIFCMVMMMMMMTTLGLQS